MKDKVELVSRQRVHLHSGLPLRVLLADGRARAVIAQYFGEWLDNPMLEMGMEMTLDQIAGAVPDLLTPEVLAEINGKLAS